MNVLVALLSGLAVALAVGIATDSLPRRRTRRVRSGPDPRAVWLAQAGVDVTATQFRAVSAGAGVAGFVLVAALTATPVVALATGTGRCAGAGRRARSYARPASACGRAVRGRTVSATCWRPSRPVARCTTRCWTSRPTGRSRCSWPSRATACSHRCRASSLPSRPSRSSSRTRRRTESSRSSCSPTAAAAPCSARSCTTSPKPPPATCVSGSRSTPTSSSSASTRVRCSCCRGSCVVALTLRPGAYRDFYASGGGLLVVSAGAVLSAIGMWAVARLGRAEPEPRVLGGGALAGVRPGEAHGG